MFASLARGFFKAAKASAVVGAGVGAGISATSYDKNDDFATVALYTGTTVLTGAMTGPTICAGAVIGTPIYLASRFIDAKPIDWAGFITEDASYRIDNNNTLKRSMTTKFGPFTVTEHREHRCQVSAAATETPLS